MSINIRARRLNEAAERPGAKYVLYWMQMNRRAESNHALEHAVGEANRLGLPLLVYEAVTCTYPYASDRFHQFLLEGVPDTQRRLGKRGIGYAFYLRRRKADANDVLYRLAAEAALCVTDDYPTFIATRHNASVPGKIGIPYVAVDSSCIVPMRLHEKKQYAAYTIRPRIKKMLPDFLRPVERVEVEQPWPGWRGGRPEWHVEVTRENVAELVASCEIDHTVGPSLSYRGGYDEARRHLDHFLKNNLKRYDTGRNNPSDHATSNLSPYLHFGHISAHEVALGAQLAAFENGLDAEPFLEELIVRRELAFNHAVWAREVDALDSIPHWAQEALRKHAGDKREPCYTREEFERAATHDALWNATQKEMLLRGKIHGYYRMYWGKKVIEWSATPQEALETMVYLHDRYALDGRDPNTYTNILWCFGLHDRPWQERPVFGMIRYMGLEGMKRKTSVDAYLREIAHMESTGSDPFRLK
ncbi:MAG: deoxyribodipyrimidine photo-lyase [Bryobacterales bacterium]|nr:deoxyribodipyrimidine photo-lyase [Bryobacterales bacterium]